MSQPCLYPPCSRPARDGDEYCSVCWYRIRWNTRNLLLQARTVPDRVLAERLATSDIESAA